MKNNFSSLLRDSGKNISIVSRDTGISRTTLTEIYYNRNKGIQFKTLMKLCRYLKCDVKDFFETNNKRKL